LDSCKRVLFHVFERAKWVQSRSISFQPSQLFGQLASREKHCVVTPAFREACRGFPWRLSAAGCFSIWRDSELLKDPCTSTPPPPQKQTAKPSDGLTLSQNQKSWRFFCMSYSMYTGDSMFWPGQGEMKCCVLSVAKVLLSLLFSKHIFNLKTGRDTTKKHSIMSTESKYLHISCSFVVCLFILELWKFLKNGRKQYLRVWWYHRLIVISTYGVPSLSLYANYVTLFTEENVLVKSIK